MIILAEMGFFGNKSFLSPICTVCIFSNVLSDDPPSTHHSISLFSKTSLHILAVGSKQRNRFFSFPHFCVRRERIVVREGSFSPPQNDPKSSIEGIGEKAAYPLFAVSFNMGVSHSLLFSLYLSLLLYILFSLSPFLIIKSHRSNRRTVF